MTTLTGLVVLAIMSGGGRAIAVGDHPPAESEPFALGRQLTLDAGEPSMQPTYIPAVPNVVATVPGAPDGEAWAVGTSSTPASHTVFLHYRRSTGWKITGPPRDDNSGRVHNLVLPGLLAVTAGGEGWAAGGQTFYHHDPGENSPWVYEAASSGDGGDQGQPFGPADFVRALSVATDDKGMFGFAVGGGGFTAYLAATGSAGCPAAATHGCWRHDTSRMGTGASAPDLSGVAAVDRNTAWTGGSLPPATGTAVGQANAGGAPSPPNVAALRRGTLYIGVRKADGWDATTTHKPEYDTSATPIDSRGQLNPGIGGIVTAVAAPPGGKDVWMVGNSFQADASQGVENTSATCSPQNQVFPCRSLPLALHGQGDPSSRTWVSYCGTPPATGVRGATDTASLTSAHCDRPFAASAGSDHLGSVAMVAGEVFAAGGGNGGTSTATSSAGLYHYSPKSDTWQHAPNSVGDAGSISFSSATEGWAVPSGIPLIGHWTNRPESSHLARWPQPNLHRLLALARDPDGSGVVMAVGEAGTIMRLDDPATGGSSGWQPMAVPPGIPSDVNLRGISWRSHKDAWAVGDRGLILHYDGTTWSLDRKSGLTPAENLLSVAVPPSPPSPPPPPGGPGSTPSPIPTPTATPPAVAPITSAVAEFGSDASNAVPSPAGVRDKDGKDLAGITAVAAGSNFRLALTHDGRVLSWGDDNSQGQLGRSNNSASQDWAKPDFVNLPSGVKVSQIAAANQHALALASDGQALYAWGENDHGELGDGHPVVASNSSATPADYGSINGAAGLVSQPAATSTVMPTKVNMVLPPGTNPKVAAIAVGDYHALAVMDDGEVYAWGDNNYGQLGRGTLGGPVYTVGAAATGAVPGGLSLCVLAAVPLPPPPSPLPSPPSCVFPPPADQQVGNSQPARVIDLPTSVTVRRVAGGSKHSLALADVSGGGQAVFAWGDDSQGQLGYPSPLTKAVPVVPDPTHLGLIPSPPPPPGSPLPQQISTGLPTQIKKLSASGPYSLVLGKDGTVYQWGLVPDPGQAGAPTQKTPAQVPGLSGITDVAAGVAAVDATGYCLARASDGSVFGFGDSSTGGLGLGMGNTTRVWPPQPIPGLAATSVTAGDGWSVVIVDQTRTAAASVTRTSAARATPSVQTARDQSTPVPSAPATGYAVGTHGTILAYRDGVWAPDPESGHVPGHASGNQPALLAVAATRTDFLAVGEQGTALTSDGTRWSVQPLPAELAVPDGNGGTLPLPLLSAIALTSDGEVFVGGSSGTILTRSDGDPALRVAAVKAGPAEGTIHALAAQRVDGRLHLLASIGITTTPTPTDPIEPYWWLVAADDSGWHDIEHGWVNVGGDLSDGPLVADGAFAVLLDPGTQRGWAVGGWRDLDCAGKSLTVSCPTQVTLKPRSSIWRIDLGGQPDPAPMETGLPIPAEKGVSFGFLANTGCRDNSCAAATGRGTRADVIAVEAMREIAEQSTFPNGPKFATLGGDLRINGLPGELDPFRHLIDTFSAAMSGKAVFAAVGPRDLATTSPPDAGTTVNSAVVNSGSSSPGLPSTAGVGGSTSNVPDLSEFHDRPAPWGGAPTLGGFVPVSVGASGPATGSLARSHYAADYAPGGVPVLRLVVLDTSVTPIATNDPNQNPTESQYGWLQAVVTEARARNLPTVVIMSQPVVAPAGGSSTDPTVTATLQSATNVAVVVAGSLHVNALMTNPAAAASSLAATLPVVVSGGGGGPLDPQTTNTLTDPTLATPANGQYHSWVMVTVDTAQKPAGAAAALLRPTVTVRSIPVLESVALSAPGGQTVGRGEALSVHGLGRLPDTGSANTGNPNAPAWESSVAYLNFPFPRPDNAATPGGGGGTRNPNVMPPDYHFTSADTSIIAPVREDPAHPGRPELVPAVQAGVTGTATLIDETSGLFCGFGAGTTEVSLQSGPYRASLPVTVAAGTGASCGTLLPIPPVVVPPPAPESKPPPALVEKPAPPRLPAARAPVPPPAPPVAVAAPPLPVAKLRVDAPAPEPVVPPHPAPVPITKKAAHPLAGAVPFPAAAELIPAPPAGPSGVTSAVTEQASDDVSLPEREEEREPAGAGADAGGAAFTRLRHRSAAQFPWQQGALEAAGAALGAWLLASTAARRRRQTAAARAAPVASRHPFRRN